MVMADSPHFVVVYLAAMRVGAIPVPVSTMLRADGIAELLRDSRARFLAVTSEFAAAAESAAGWQHRGGPELAGVLADSAGPAPRAASTLPVYLFDDWPAGPGRFRLRHHADSPAFWLYTSGTTGTPKGAMHRHGSIPVVCETYGQQVLGIRPEDRCLSAAKAFFAYGLGNSLLFPLSAGAASVLLPPPSRPDLIAETAVKYGATLFFGGPTFFANMLRAGMPADALGGVRLAASAGEALPAALQQRWTSHFGVDIIDGIGMTEMLHIFLSNQQDDWSATRSIARPRWTRTWICCAIWLRRCWKTAIRVSWCSTVTAATSTPCTWPCADCSRVFANTFSRPRRTGTWPKRSWSPWSKGPARRWATPASSRPP